MLEYRIDARRVDELAVAAQAGGHKLELLHRNARKYRTIYNAVKQRTRLEGPILRR